jgi:uncharacterized membrane protein (TIGR01666 family)
MVVPKFIDSTLRSVVKEPEALVNNQVRELRYFLFSQHLADGFRICISILFPVLIFAHFGHFEIGLSISIGAVCLSVTDMPGPILHKRNAMMYCSALLFLVAIITGFASRYPLIMGVEVVLFGFFFSMFAVYGVRAGAVGGAALLVMILVMGKPVPESEIVTHAFLILSGAIWYLLLSLAFTRLWPYRAAQRALGECISEIAKFLQIKSEFYTVNSDLQEAYRHLVAQQVVVSQKQDDVRELLFKTRQIIRDSSGTGRRLMLIFIDMLDLYEQVTIIYYDYDSIREKYGQTGILDKIADIIRHMATELDNIGFAIQSNIRYKSAANLDAQLEHLREEIILMSVHGKEDSHLVLGKILVNLRNLKHRVSEIIRYSYAESIEKERRSRDIGHSRFVSHQEYSFQIFKDNLTFSSSAFKHAVRVAVAALAGFMVAHIFDYGNHSYWILLTVVFILKPAYSLTKQRNVQRITGTIVGGIIGALILIYIPDKRVLFFFLVFFMMGTYSFLRMNYILMVICVTPYMLIVFKFFGAGYIDILQERLVDTAIGCTLAFMASYLLFPNWESEQLEKNMIHVLKANMSYLQKLADSMSGKQVAPIEYRLARKDVYVASANLSVTFQRMLSEPKKRQRKNDKVYEFVVLNHILASNLATFASSDMLQKQATLYSAEELRPLFRSVNVLNQCLKKLDEQDGQPEYSGSVTPPAANVQELLPLKPADQQFMKEQLEFIMRVCNDIYKLTGQIKG